jgi:hypothetical protein
MNGASLFWTLLACLAVATAVADLADDTPADQSRESRPFRQQVLDIARSTKQVGSVDCAMTWAPTRAERQQRHRDVRP